MIHHATDLDQLDGRSNVDVIADVFGASLLINPRFSVNA